MHRSTPRPSLSSPCQVRLISSRASLIIIIISTLFILTLLHPQPALAGTAAELTTPPVTGAPAQASPKASAPLDQPDSAAKALAARRESTSIDNSLKAALEKPSAAAAQATAAAKEESAKLKEFVQDDRHFSLVRCASPPSHLVPFSLQHLTDDRPCSQELPPRRLRHPRQRLLRRPLALLVGRVPAQQRPALPLVRSLSRPS